MSVLEEFEQKRRLSLAAIFVCSTLVFSAFMILAVYSWNHTAQSFPHEKALAFAVCALVVLMSAIVLWRFLLLRRLIRKHPSLRSVLQDERVKFSWLKAYRVAFFVLLAIQAASKFPIVVRGVPWDVPGQCQISLSAAVMTMIGAFLFYTREAGHE
jgi:hypothetical protein